MVVDSLLRQKKIPVFMFIGLGICIPVHLKTPEKLHKTKYEIFLKFYSVETEIKLLEE